MPAVKPDVAGLGGRCAMTAAILIPAIPIAQSQQIMRLLLGSISLLVDNRAEDMPLELCRFHKVRTATCSSAAASP